MYSGSTPVPGWADLPPGPELATALDSADPAQASDDDLIELICARHRQAAATQAAELAAIAELARRRAGGTTAGGGFADSEISCALHITPSAAGAYLDLAVRLATSRRATLDLFAGGLIDYGKAKALADELDGIDDALARHIEDTLLPQAPVLTSAQLRGRIRRMIEKADPDAITKRKRAAIASRDLARWRNHEGTWTVAIRHLHGTTAGRIHARIAAQARALKTDGDPRPLHQIRADLTTAILLGEHPNGYNGPLAGDGPDGTGSTGGTDDTGSAGGGSAGGTDGSGGPCSGRDGGEPPCSGPLTPLNEDCREPGDPALSIPFDDTKTRTGPSPLPQPALRHDETAVTEDVPEDFDTGEYHQAARQQRHAAAQAAAIIADTLAGLSQAFTTRPRAPTAELARLADQITGSLTPLKTLSCVTTELPGGKIIHGRPTYRPPPRMRKHIQAHDQRCQFPSCNRRAEFCDEDHTIPHHHGGPTCPCNIACLCRSHHRLKQDRNWRVFHPWPGVLIWITPAGKWHINRPESAAPTVTTSCRPRYNPATTGSSP